MDDNNGLPHGLALGYSKRMQVTHAAYRRIRQHIKGLDDPSYALLDKALESFLSTNDQGCIAAVLPDIDKGHSGHWHLWGYSNLRWLYDGKDYIPKKLYEVDYQSPPKAFYMQGFRRLYKLDTLNELLKAYAFNDSDWVNLPNCLYHEFKDVYQDIFYKREGACLTIKMIGAKGGLELKLYPNHYESEHLNLINMVEAYKRKHDKEIA